MRCIKCGAEMLHQGTEEKEGKLVIEVFRCPKCGDTIRENTENKWVKW